MAVNRYQTPAAVRVALEDRIRAASRQAGRPMDRTRILLVMERFLARALVVLPSTTLLKGGLALELHLGRARTTRDIDLRLMGPPDGAALLRAAAELVLDPDDHLRFGVRPHPAHPTMEGDGLLYEGERYRVDANIATKPYATFGVDLAWGDVVTGDPPVNVGSDLLSFLGIEPLRVRCYPPTTHIAEKLHAYTLPRPHPNTRLKDLVDLALLGTSKGHTSIDLDAAIRATFRARDTHPVPSAVSNPPAAWTPRYATLRAEDDLGWVDLPALVAAVRAFLDPLLDGVEGTWDPASWSWSSS